MRLLFPLLDISRQLVVFVVILLRTQFVEFFEILYEMVLIVEAALKDQVLPVDLFIVVMRNKVVDGRHAYDTSI